MTFQFEKLLVYQKSVDFADQVCGFAEQFTRGHDLECVTLLELACSRTLSDDARHAELKANLEGISKMLSGLISGLENRKT